MTERYYLCDPKKAAFCNKTLCYANGGPCSMTSNVINAVTDIYGNPVIKSYFDEQTGELLFTNYDLRSTQQMEKFGSCSRCHAIIFFESPPPAPEIGSYNKSVSIKAQAETVWGFAHHYYNNIYTNGAYGSITEVEKDRKDFQLCKKCGAFLLKWLKGEDDS